MERRQEAENLIASGYSYRQAGLEMGISHARVHDLIMPSKERRAEVYERANNACEWCHLPLPSRGHIHHLRNLIPDFNDITNLLLLCSSCHSLAHRDRVCLKCLRDVDAQDKHCRNCGSTELQVTGERDVSTTMRIDDDLMERIDSFALEFSYDRSRAIRILVEVALSHDRNS